MSLLALVGVGVNGTAANAATSFTQIDVTGTLTHRLIYFNARVGVNNLCLDDNVHSSPHADVQSCAAGATFPGIYWDYQENTSDRSFLIRYSAGCLAYSGNPATNGTPVVINSEPCSFSNAAEMWSFWSNGTMTFLAPATLTTNNGTFVYGSTTVVSITGTPAAGSSVHMWHSGANSDQQINSW